MRTSFHKTHPWHERPILPLSCSVCNRNSNHVRIADHMIIKWQCCCRIKLIINFYHFFFVALYRLGSLSVGKTLLLAL